MNNPFVKTEIKETKTIEYTKDGSLSNGALFSVMRDGPHIAIVVGAKYDSKMACYFSKYSLIDLSNVIKEIAEAMEG